VTGAAVAVLAAGVVYINALHAPYVYDDYRTILSNASLTPPLDWRALLFFDLTRPVTNLSFAVDHLVWKTMPFGLHVTNVLLHMLNTALVFALARRVARDSTRAGARLDERAVAFMTSALFAVHPLMTETVTYISSRSDLLVATALLSAFLCARRWALGGGARWWMAAAVLWAIGIATKETALIAPVLLLAWDLLLAGPDGRRRRLLKLHVPIWLIAMAAGVWRMTVFVVQEHGGAVSVQSNSILQQFDAARRYALLIIAPAGQSIFHAPASITGWTSPAALAGIVTVAGLGCTAWWLRKRQPAAAFGIIWFLVALVPSAAVFVMGHGDAMAEHRANAAVIGALMAFAAIATWALNLPGLATPRVKWLARLALAAMLLSLSARTWARNMIWADPISLWSEAVAVNPGAALPHSVLGESLHAAGAHDQAIAEYERAIALDPADDTAYLKLATCLAELQRTDEATRAVDRLAAVAPHSPLIPAARGMVALLSGHIDAARAEFERGLTGTPDDVLALRWLALLEEDYARNPAAAFARCQEISRYLPLDRTTRECLARTRAMARAGGT
jgi:tetratricopeptide (TPR) repeat protein